MNRKTESLIKLLQQCRVKHVYIVLEYPINAKGSPKVHGVFDNREHAADQATKLPERNKKTGYIAVLKKRILR